MAGNLFVCGVQHLEEDKSNRYLKILKDNLSQKQLERFGIE